MSAHPVGGPAPRVVPLALDGLGGDGVAAVEGLQLPGLVAPVLHARVVEGDPRGRVVPVVQPAILMGKGRVVAVAGCN